VAGWETVGFWMVEEKGGVRERRTQGEGRKCLGEIPGVTEVSQVDEEQRTQDEDQCSGGILDVAVGLQAVAT
jgi:hypothetical protein